MSSATSVAKKKAPTTVSKSISTGRCENGSCQNGLKVYCTKCFMVGYCTQKCLKEHSKDHHSECKAHQDAMAPKCGNCAKKSLRIYCPNCYVTGYCSKKCQQAHKSQHDKACLGIGDGFDDDDDDYGDDIPPPPAWMGPSYGKNKSKTVVNGTGYGGDARSDQQKRKAGIKAAQKREAKDFGVWQQQLQAFVSNHQTATKSHSSITPKAPSSQLMDTLKRVLRCQAPDWWWKQPQRLLHVTALQACGILTESFPKEWGDPDDSESAIAALETLAQTSKLLVKQLGKENASSSNNNKNNETKNAAKHSTNKKNTHDKDASLPRTVMEIRDAALAAVAQVVEKPECSMMDSSHFYREKLQPLAFETVEKFDHPIHYYAAGGGYASRPTYPYPGYAAYKKPKTVVGKMPAKGNTNRNNTKDTVQTSAAVLWKELSTYPTALPIEYGSSIFVRTLDDKMDHVRVLITGPEDTPYSNGCFVFDVSMGDDYPHKPPKVQFLTTSSFLCAKGKTVRFNPNLYNDGKVCLSLLGTWSGPGWDPGVSTLLQVLLSIQSLILVPDPYFNEPGFERSRGTPSGKAQSDGYNKNIRKQTLEVAILPFLQNLLNSELDAGEQTIAPPAAKADAPGKRKDPPGTDATTNKKSTVYFEEFQEVIKQHFRLKKQVLQKQLFQWLQEDSSLDPLYQQYWNIWDQLEQHWHPGTSGGGARRAAKRPQVDGPAVKEKNGVILLDDDDFEAQTRLAIQLSVDGAAQHATKTTSSEEPIELDDSDDEDSDKKPAAADVGNAKKTPARIEMKGPPQSGQEAGCSTEQKSLAAAQNDVVDLT